MAHCSEAERQFAVARVEDWSAGSGYDYHEVFDKLLEAVRHDLLELVAVLWEGEGENLLALRDLLTSLKCDAGECILSGQPSRPCIAFQDILRHDSGSLKRLWSHSRVLAALTLPTGAARSGLVWLQTQHCLGGQDIGCRVSFASAAILLLVLSGFLVFSRGRFFRARGLRIGSRWRPSCGRDCAL